MVVSLASQMGATDLAYHLRAGADVLAGNIPGSTRTPSPCTATVAGPAVGRAGVFGALFTGRWLADADVRPGRVGRTHVLPRLSRGQGGGGGPPNGVPPDDRRLRGGLTGPRDAASARRAAAVRGAAVGHGGAPSHIPARLWLAPGVGGRLREHPRQLHDVPADPRARVARGPAHSRSGCAPDAADRDRDRGGDVVEPVRVRGSGPTPTSSPRTPSSATPSANGRR